MRNLCGLETRDCHHCYCLLSTTCIWTDCSGYFQYREQLRCLQMAVVRHVSALSHCFSIPILFGPSLLVALILHALRACTFHRLKDSFTAAELFCTSQPRLKICLILPMGTLKIFISFSVFLNNWNTVSLNYTPDKKTCRKYSWFSCIWIEIGICIEIVLGFFSVASTQKSQVVIEPQM